MNSLDWKHGIITDYVSGYNISKLDEKYCGRRSTIRKVLFNEGLIDSIEPKRKKFFEGKDNQEIRKNVLIKYETEKDIRTLSKEFKIPSMSIYNLLRKENVFDAKYGMQLKVDKTRKYPINEHYFDEIDCEEKAYFLGMLYADGCNMVDSTEVSLRLQEDDYEILVKLNDLLQPTRPINYRKTTGNRKKQRGLLINSKLISYRLNELGMVQNKTFVLVYPLWLRDDLHRHFIRGYFDGDGCVTFNKINKQLCISFTGTEDMMLGIQNVLINRSSFTKTKLSTRHPERNNNIRSLQYFGNNNSRKYYRFIYDDANIFMKRKKDKFNKHINTN